MAHTGIVTIIIMVLEAATISEIAESTTVTCLATGMAEEDTAGGERIHSPQYE